MAIRTMLIYLFLLGAMRLMGKRQIGELQVSELVTTLLLSELASQPITDSEIPLCNALIPILLLLSTEIWLSFLVTKIPIFKKILSGTPSILINCGKVDVKELKRARLSVEELMAELRLKNISSFDQVNYAILEQNGKISFFPKAQDMPPNNKDLKLNVKESGIAHILIADGKYDKNSMAMIGWKEADIKQALKEKHIRRPEDVFILTVDDTGELFVMKKEKKKNK